MWQDVHGAQFRTSKAKKNSEKKHIQTSWVRQVDTHCRIYDDTHSEVVSKHRKQLQDADSI